jgi:Transposase/Transposase IS116/IS110/IS902 family
MDHAFLLWVGIDWATEEHRVCGVDGEGTKLFEWSIRHTGEAIAAFVERLVAQVDGHIERVAVAIETPRGSIIEALVERGVAGFSINPKQLDRFRDRHTVGGAKSDALDAFVLADSLRTDLRLYRRIELGDPLLVELREMVRVHDGLTTDGGALGSRLREQIHRYYPQILELGSVYEDSWLLTLLELAPTPARAAHLQRGKVTALLRKHRVRRVTADQVLAAIRSKPLLVAPGVVEAASSHVRLLLPVVRANRAQLAACDRIIEDLMGRLGRPAEPGPTEAAEATEASSSSPEKKHRDADILLSVAGLGVLTSATMLTEASTALRDRDYQALRTQAGVAPVSSQTGKQRRPTVSMRRACNPRLRNAVYHWANVNAQRDCVSRAHYARMRRAGHSHGRALRGVADRLLAMLVAMLRSGSLYDPRRRGPEAATANTSGQAQQQGPGAGVALETLAIDLEPRAP